MSAETAAESVRKPPVTPRRKASLAVDNKTTATAVAKRSSIKSKPARPSEPPKLKTGGTSPSLKKAPPIVLSSPPSSSSSRLQQEQSKGTIGGTFLLCSCCSREEEEEEEGDEGTIGGTFLF